MEAIAAATNALAPAGGIDCDGDGVIDLPEGAPLVCTTAITGEGVGAAMEAVIEAAVKPTTVTLQVQPSINLHAALIPVAILSTNTFDARDVDRRMVCFGAADPIPGVGDCTEAHDRAHFDDVNGDGLLDQVLHYNTTETGIASGATQACLTGQTFDGQQVEGCAPITVVP
jgi:hypothetical protein